MKTVLKLLMVFMLVYHNLAFIDLDKFKDLVDNVTEKLKKEFKDLKDDIKEIVSDAKEFAKASVDKIKNIKQDLISSLHTIKAMTDEQFKGMKDRLKDFTADNLKNFMKNINKTVLENNLGEISKMKLKKVQAYLFASATYDLYGKDIGNWTSTQIKSLKKLLVGLPSSAFKKFSKNALKQSLEEFCNIGLSFQQKINLLKSATNVFGKEKDWKSTDMEELCDSIEELTPEQIQELSAKELAKFVKKLNDYQLSSSQRAAFLDKVKEEWGKASEITKDQMKDLGKLMRSFSIEDLNELDAEKLQQVIKSAVSKVWDPTQIQTYLKEIKTKVGKGNLWSKDFVEDVFSLLPYESNITDIELTKIWDAIKADKYANWTLAQSKYFLDKETIKLKELKMKDIIQRGQWMHALSETEAGQFTKALLFAAFPGLKVVAKLSPPVLRYFVSVYNETSTNGEIENLGQFVSALSRHEISEQNIKDVLSSIEKVSGKDLDEAQIATLFIKLREQLGNLNDTDAQEEDILKWGFQNFQKMGILALGLGRKELLNFPDRDIENSMEVLGQQDGWKRRACLAFVKRLKLYWKSQNKTMEDLQEVDVEIMGKFVQGLTLDDLKLLNDDAKQMAIKKLGEFTQLPDDKLEARAKFAYDYLKELNGDISSSDLKMLNGLLRGLSNQIKDINPDVIMNNLNDLMENNNLDKDSLKEIFEVAKEKWGGSGLKQWTIDQVRSIIPTLKAVDIDEMKDISKEAFESLSEQIATLEGWSKEQQEAIVEKFKEAFGEDITLWKSDIMDRVSKLFNGLKDSDIAKMTKENFMNLDRELRDKYINKETAEKLAKRFKEIGDKALEQMSHIDLKRFHGMLKGFSTSDLQKIKFNTTDELAVFGEIKDWSTQQLRTLSEKAKAFLSGPSSKSDDYVSLGHLIRGYTKEDVEAIPDKAFKISAGVFGKVENKDKDLAKALINKAKAVWNNNVENWNEGQISEAKHFLFGLDSSDIPKIKEEAIEYVPSEVIEQLDNSQIQAFTVAQLSEFNSEQVKAIDSNSKDSLPPAKAAALKSVADEDPEEKSDTTTGSAVSVANSVFITSIMVIVVYLV